MAASFSSLIPAPDRLPAPTQNSSQNLSTSAAALESSTGPATSNPTLANAPNNSQDASNSTPTSKTSKNLLLRRGPVNQPRKRHLNRRKCALRSELRSPQFYPCQFVTTYSRKLCFEEWKKERKDGIPDEAFEEYWESFSNTIKKV